MVSINIDWHRRRYSIMLLVANDIMRHINRINEQK